MSLRRNQKPSPRPLHKCKTSRSRKGVKYVGTSTTHYTPHFIRYGQRIVPAQAGSPGSFAANGKRNANALTSAGRYENLSSHQFAMQWMRRNNGANSSSTRLPIVTNDNRSDHFQPILIAKSKHYKKCNGYPTQSRQKVRQSLITEVSLTQQLFSQRAAKTNAKTNSATR